MKEKILKLRKDGKSYRQISEILKCSKGTISYYCGVGQKDKTRNRLRKRRENVLLTKVERFKNEKTINTLKNVKNNFSAFQENDIKFKNRFNKNIKKTFDWNDVIKKFGVNTYCYLSGEEINLFEKTYELDHIIPLSKNGNNSIDNLGILNKTVNKMKHDLTPDEFIDWCIKILKYNGYKVEK
jgi:5-methylcytosine-specific restriction endonuclease McrA